MKAITLPFGKQQVSGRTCVTPFGVIENAVVGLFDELGYTLDTRRWDLTPGRRCAFTSSDILNLPKPATGAPGMKNGLVLLAAAPLTKEAGTI
jgi:hypothetical protein